MDYKLPSRWIDIDDPFATNWLDIEYNMPIHLLDID